MTARTINAWLDKATTLALAVALGAAAPLAAANFPVGLDYMRSPAGTERALLSWTVVDQVMPLPYTVGSDELDATDWISTFSGLDGTSDSTATIRRHSTLRAGADFKSTRLVGRSAWNDKWLIVIPASAIDADRDRAMNLIESGVKDIKIGIRAYSRSGN